MMTNSDASCFSFNMQLPGSAKTLFYPSPQTARPRLPCTAPLQKLGKGVNTVQSFFRLIYVCLWLNMKYSLGHLKKLTILKKLLLDLC